MPFRRIHKIISYLMAVQGLGLLALSGELTLPGSVLVFVAVAASWFIEGERFGAKKYVNFFNALTVAVFILQFVRWMAGEGLPIVAVQFAAFLQINKLFNRRRQNDYDQIAILSILHLIASAILYTEISYALVFVLYAVVTPWMLVLGQIRREVEAKYWDRSDRRSIKDLERVLNSRRIISGSFLASTALLSIPIYVMTALLFLFFPRIGFGLLASSDPSQRQLTGFSDQVVIGDLEPLFDDPTVVLRVEFPDETPSDAVLASIYWRGSAYDSFDGTQWSRTLGHGHVVNSRGEFYVVSQDRLAAGRPSTSGMTRMSVFLQPLYPKVIFVPQHAALLSVPAPEPLRVMRQKLRWGPGEEIRYSDPGGTGINYEVWLQPDFTTAVPALPYEGKQSDQPESLEPYLQLPPVPLALQELGDRYREQYPDPQRRAEAIEKWFRTEFGYTVTASLEVPDGKQPIEAFLVDWKQGNCEYFSTAMVLILRVSGIPARNVTGFIGGAWNDMGDYLAVREADAHSWVEVHIPGQGWTIYDPTPPAEAVAESRARFAFAMEFIDTMRLSWHKHIIAYDLQHQAEILRQGYRGFTAVRSALEGFDTDMNPGLGSTTRRIVILLIIVAAFIIYHVTRRQNAPQGLPLSRKQRKAHRKALDLIGLLDRRLDEVGLRRPSARPPLMHARIVQDDVENPDPLNDIVVAYNETRYGGWRLPRDRFETLRQKVPGIKRKDPSVQDPS